MEYNEDGVQWLEEEHREKWMEDQWEKWYRRAALLELNQGCIH